MSAIVATLGLNSSPFAASLNSTLPVVRNFGMRINGILASLGAGISFGAVAVGLKKALDVGGALSDLSASSSAPAGDLAILQQAFKNAGLSADAVGPSFSKARRAIAAAAEGSQPAIAALGKLGLTAAGLGNLGATDQIMQIGSAINAIENPTARAAAAMDIFGKSGASMLALFGDAGALSFAAEQLGAQAELLSKDAALFDALGDSIDGAGVKLQGLFVGVLDKLAPALLPMSEAFNKIDLTRFGQQIGAGVAYITNTLANMKLDELLFGDIVRGWRMAIDFIASELGYLPKLLLDALGSGNLGKLIGESITVGILTSLKDLNGAVDALLPSLAADLDALTSAAGENLAATLAEITAAGEATQSAIDAQAAAATGASGRRSGALGISDAAGGMKPDIGALFSDSLQRIGGGGGFVGASTSWTMRAYEEARRQTGFLQQIAANTRPRSVESDGVTKFE